MERPEPAENPSREGQHRKQRLLLVMLVVSVTYVAGLNPPGGVWQENGAGHKAGDPILRDTSRIRFLAFYYCNAMALAASLMVIFLLLLKKPRRELQLSMVLYLLGLTGAYWAGTAQKTRYPEYIFMVVFSLPICYYVGIHFLRPVFLLPQAPEAESRQGSEEEELEEGVLLKPKEQRKVLLLLATFATAITYLAGLSSPGGYWDRAESKGAYNPGDALLEVNHKRRFLVFFYCNTTAFSMSLFIVILLIDKKTSDKTAGTLTATLYFGLLLGLLGAYIAGSCRNIDTAVYVVSLIGAALAIFTVLISSMRWHWHRQSSSDSAASAPGGGRQAAAAAAGGAFVQLGSSTNRLDASAHGGGRQAAAAAAGGAFVQLGSSTNSLDEASRKVKSLTLLLATLAATITYQAGLEPPGGVWPDDRDGHSAGDPILLSTHPRRYKVFIYCNSSAFMVSLAAILMLQNEKLVKSHTTLLVSMMLDMFALLGAYAAGSWRDVRSSLYVVATAGGAVALYMTVYVMCITLSTTDMENRRLKKRHKRLLLVAILVATITYQAGLNPPGGFRREDDDGHAAGGAVLLENYPRRVRGFFYCNTVSFMATIALILLFVSPNLYRLAIRCYALYACIVLSLLGLMVAYVAGSARSVQSSIYVIVLVAGVVSFIAAVTIRFRLFLLEKDGEEGEEEDEEDEDEWSSAILAPAPRPRPRTRPGPRPRPRSRPRGAQDTRYREVYASRKYLMLLGILAASVTYQAGLYPPGGMWQDDGDHVEAGSPVLYDRKRRRYLLFFYGNSTSFVASVFIIALQLQQIWRRHQPRNNKLFLLVTNTAVVLDLLGLLAAYAAGTTWELENGIALAVLVLLCIAIHVVPCISSFIYSRRDQEA